MANKTRKELKSYFVKNAIPTEGNFADLIDAQLNQSDDGVFKLPNEPLSVVADGGGQKRVLRLYATYPTANPDWLVNLNPAQDPANPATNRAGFGIADGAGRTRLFIDPATGNLGVGTNNPADKLTVQEGDLRIEGGRHRRLKVVSDKHWAGIELVAREQGEAGSPYIDFTHGQLDAPDYGIRVQGTDNKTLSVLAGDGTALLDVRGNLTYSGTQNKLDVAEQGQAIIRAADLKLGVTGRRGTPGRALVDGGGSLIVNYGSDWPRTDVHGPLSVGTNLCIGAAETTTFPLDVRVPGGANGWNRFVVKTTSAWGDANTQYVTIGAEATGIMFWNPHVPWMPAPEARASIRYGRTGGTAGNTWWDVGVRADGGFSLLAQENGGVGETFSVTKAGNASVRGELRVNGARIRNASGLGMLEGNANDWLRINPDEAFPGIALYKSLAMGTGGLAVGDWSQLPAGQLKVTGTASFGGVVSAPAGLRFDGAVAHIDTDGALYRNADGQVYLTVDDNLYIRKSGSGANHMIHFDINSGNLTLRGSVLRIGDWTIESGGNHLYIKRGSATVARFSVGNDRFNVFRNVNGTGPYFYYNQQGNYSAYDGTGTPP